MPDDLGNAMINADEMVRPAHAGIRPGQCYIKFRHGSDIPIFGEILVISNLGIDGLFRTKKALSAWTRIFFMAVVGTRYDLGGPADTALHHENASADTFVCQAALGVLPCSRKRSPLPARISYNHSRFESSHPCSRTHKSRPLQRSTQHPR